MAKHLRPTRLDEAKRDQLLKEVEADRKRLNDAVAGLASPAIGITVEDVETLRKVSQDWLKSYLTSNYKRFVEASGFVPAATRQRVLDEYNQAGAAAEPFVDAIKAVTAKWKDFPIKQDSKGKFWFDDKTVKAWATEQATRHFTEVSHWRTRTSLQRPTLPVSSHYSTWSRWTKRWLLKQTVT